MDIPARMPATAACVAAATKTPPAALAALDAKARFAAAADFGIVVVGQLSLLLLLLRLLLLLLLLLLVLLLFLLVLLLLLVYVSR